MEADSATSAHDRCHDVTDPIHLLSYFAPEVEAEYVSAGLEPGHMSYFAGRAAALGHCTPGVVAAVFYNFNPALIATHLPRAWELAAPERVLAARLSGVDRALRRILGDAVVTADSTAEAADLAEAAARACSPEGRPLHAAHRDLPWPDAPHLRLWHAITLLREHRGDGHVAALVDMGIGAIAALITDTATGRSLFTAEAARQHRGWSAEAWESEVAQLAGAGVLDAAKRLSSKGNRLRHDLELATSAAAAGPYRAIGSDGVARLTELCLPLHDTITAAGVLPGTVAEEGGSGA